MRLPASGSWWFEQILDTVPNERFCARDLKESKSDRTYPAAFLCVKRSLQSRGIGQICVFFDANGASIYRALLARQQGIVVAGCKSSSLEIRRISLLKATRSALKIEMIFEGSKSVVKNLKTLVNTGEIGFYFCC